MAKKNVRKNMTDRAGQEIRRTWGDLEVVDAKKDLRVFIAPEDVMGATKKDPAYCVFARACRRAFHATKVLFFRTVAYVELPDETGRRRVERFHMGDSMRDLIAAFDRGQGVIPDAGFLLRAPTPGMTLSSERRRSLEKHRKERQRRRMLLGHGDTPKKPQGQGIGRGKGKFRDEPLLVDLSVRSGTGAVHFNCKDQAG